MNFKWKEPETAAAGAARVLPKLVKAYFKSGRWAMKHERSWDELHAFRLESKRFRYTLEIFRPLYGPLLDERIASLKKLQQLLGEINDAVATAALLKGHPDYAGLRDQLKDKAAKKTQVLVKHWHEKFDGEGEEDAWTRVVAQA
jgi:CHAD domain-containing protein